jgi:hypothetical protein
MSNYVKRGEAIKELYSNVVSNIDNKAFDVDNNEVSLDETAIANKIVAMETVETDKATAKTVSQESGNTKLLGLGLTQSEATALTGYTPE